jgi:hypothetical protein
MAINRAGIVRVCRTQKSALGNDAKASAIPGRAGAMIATSTVVVLPSSKVILRRVILETIEA